MKYSVIDLFAGVGGLSLGFKMEDFDILLANEIDKSIAESYKKNNPETNVINEDITKLNISEVFGEYKNKIDVIVGGPPCQGFSQKGSRKSINDSRNFLFRYFFEVVKYVEPKFFVMENVPNLLTNENGFFKGEIEKLFSDINYFTSFQIVSAADFGVPQNRKRAIIIGSKKNKKIRISTEEKISVTIWDAISDLYFLESGEGEFSQNYKYPPQSDYQKELRGQSQRLYNHIATKHSPMALKKLSLIPVNGGDKSSLPPKMLTKSIYSGTWSRMKKDEHSVTITTRFDTPSSGRFAHPFLNRAITVREAARIQSFPDSFIFWGNKSSQMKQVGNAVPPKLSRVIAKTILKELKENDA